LTSNAKRRLAAGVAAALAAAVGSVTLAIHGASAGSDPTVPEGINVPAISTGASTALIASLEGRNEATAGSDNGQALELIGIQGNTLTYSIAWRALGAPTQATIHAGTRGADGPVVVTLFATPPSTDDVASGTVTVDDPTLLAALRSNPSDFYAEMTTKKSPDGAVRAQLHLLTHAVSTSGVAAVQESVVFGSQIYACTVQTDGNFAFAQHDVDAHLTGDIHHTFVRPLAGTPQWQAPDGSAVSGKLVTKNANGADNIAELNLDATQIGTAAGLLGNVVEVLRLNTHGGLAPTGPCDPQATPIVNVPYGADYVFING
jgi:hypothetical protein